VIHKLRCNKPFVKTLERGSKGMHAAFIDLSDAVRGAEPVIKIMRNEVGGHVLEKPIREGLARIGRETKVLFQDGERPSQIHYHFAMEFLGATVLRHVDVQKAKEEWERMLKVTLKLGFKACPAIDVVFRAYQHMRNLRG
jgi:hypothetical protein